MISKWTSLDHAVWNAITPQTLKLLRNNPQLHDLLVKLDPRCTYHTSKKNVYIRTSEGRVTVHPKDGTKPYCLQCWERLKHMSPVAFGEDSISGSDREYVVPYCVNEDRRPTIDRGYSKPNCCSGR